MKAISFSTWVLLGLLGPALSGCYTVIRAPRTAADVQTEVIWKSERSARAGDADPRLGRFEDERDDHYRYPGSPYGGYGGSPYSGYGGGFPLLGYDSRYGMYGAGGYGYGYPNYGGGYGPYGYGYDPYYTDDSGFYAPPGYELISTRELEDMHDTIRTLSSQESQPGGEGLMDPPPVFDRFERDQEEVWENRITPSRTRDSGFSSRPASSAPRKLTSSPSSSSSSSSSGSSKPSSSSKSTDKKPSIKKSSKKRGR